MENKVYKLVYLSIIFIFFISCGTSKIIESSTVTSSPAVSEKDDREITISVDNPTIYNVYIEGDIERRIGKRSNNNKVTLLVEDGPLSGGFNIFYEIPLSNSVSIFCKGDHRVFRENQTSFVIAEPRPIENYGTIITLHNRANNAVSFLSGTTRLAAWIQTGSPKMGNKLTPSKNKVEFNPNETVVFRIDHDSRLNNYSIRDGRKSIPLILPQNVEKNYRYSFEYSVDGVTLTDSRPLHRIGEDAWAKTINDAAGPMPLVAADGEIHLFASTKSGLIRNVYDSASNERSIPNGESFNITYANKAGNGFFIAGYEKLANGNYRPIARIQNMDGSTQDVLNHSEEYMARFFTAAHKDNATWLLAGDGAKRGPYGNTASAYARLVRVVNDKFTVVRELGENNFTDKKCGVIKSAIYDNTRHCWFVTGENIEFDTMQNPIVGSYIARIGDDGTVQKIDHSFRDMLFNKILIDTNGICYLAGEEQRGNESYAILVKYNVNDSNFQKIFTQAASHSYYHDALPDTANNRIVLGGVMKAADETGRNGVPFVEAVNIQTGSLIWREELSDTDIKGAGAVLVTAIASAPDYGFALALSGIGSTTGYYEKPYMIVRVNSQGKYIKERRQ